MSSESDGGAFAELQQLLVKRPRLVTFGSFEEGLKDPAFRTRTKRAKEEWKVTDEMTVLSYSYSLDALRIIFDDATLDVVAAGPTVEWSVRTSRMPPLAGFLNPSCVVRVDYGGSREIFDRDRVLRSLIGIRIRYAPSAEGLYLIWKPNCEIGLMSLPLADRDEYLLHYSGPVAV